ncbi:PREDICTED: tripartite motif-containing protein 15-like [Sturnus vulgaris]|uniref:tripartite motif-containing protein 15-like n=1 Tax=Sturnus vulgaris TaxID=9172 RepID=UPI00071A0458|nr:PREDICTED: tripartite motif-containing protein 15-like [Sturnus vulgaris]
MAADARRPRPGAVRPLRPARAERGGAASGGTGSDVTPYGGMAARVANMAARMANMAAPSRCCESNAKLTQLSAESPERDSGIPKCDATIQLRDREIGQCLEEHRKDEERVARVTLDPLTSHPLLLLSPDGLVARWAYGGPEPPASPERFTAAPCALGQPAFTSGRHTWTVAVSEGPFCAVGVSLGSVLRGSRALSPRAGVWAVQRWGGQARALTEPPTPLPRLPRRLRVALDYEGGRVAFFDGDRPGASPLFAFGAAAFGGESVRPWFWLELGEISIVP